MKITKIVMRLVIAALLSVTILIFIYLSLIGVAAWKQGYSWEEMDWNQKGYTSIFDFFSASDIGKRDFLVNGKFCVEYYAYKDGLPVKTTCPHDHN